MLMVHEFVTEDIHQSSNKMLMLRYRFYGFVVSWIFIVFGATRTSGAQVTISDNRTFKLVRTRDAKMLPLVGYGPPMANASTLSECAAKCKQRAQECLSFTYNSTDESCLLGSWTTSTGKMYSDGCSRDKDSSTYKSQSLTQPNGKLYTAACCHGDYILRTLSMQAPKCLYYPQKSLSFIEAKYDCGKRRGQMITFKTELEMVTVQDLLNCMGNTWIGLRDNCDEPNINCKTDRRFYWPGGMELSKELAPQVTERFDNSGNKEDCVQLGWKYPTKLPNSFNDAGCANKYYYVCEKDPYGWITWQELSC